jgi:hypothetical protein
MTVMLDQPPELLWGSFALCTVVDPDVPWQCTTLATTEFGNAVPIIEFIESSLIVDGGEAVVTGWERRTFTVAIRITAPDGQAMAQAQNALFDLVYADEKPALLWTPPMVGAWTGAFDVVAVKFVRKYDVGGGWDYREKHTRQRVFELEFTTKTWVRDPEPIEVPAAPTTATVVDIDTCDTAAGWSRTYQGFGPTTRTNLMTNTSFETSLSGWALGSVPRPGVWSASRVTGGARLGSASMYVSGATGSPNEIPIGSRVYVNSPLITSGIEGGKTYHVLLSQNSPVSFLPEPSTIGGVLTRFYTSTGVQIGSDEVTTWTLVDAWQDFATTRVAPAGAAQMQIFPFLQHTSTKQQYGHSFGVDRVYIGRENGYFDGDTADTIDWIYAWTGTANESTSTATSTTAVPTLSASGGHVDVAATASPSYSDPRSVTLTRTAATTLGDLPYLRVSAKVSATGGTAVLSGFKIDGASVAPVFVGASDIAGYSDYYFALADDFNTLAITATADGGANQPTVTISVAHIAATDGFGPIDANGFQLARVVTIEGAAPTGAAITFDAGPNPLLGSTALIYTGPSEVISMRALDDGVPPGRTPDATMMSGAWNTLNGDTVSLVPVARLSDSKYDLLGRLNFTGTARVYWSARLVGADGSDIPGSDVVRSGDILLRNDTADPWKIHTIATIAMPVIKVEGLSTHNVEVKVWMASGGAAVKLDERWLADRRGAVTLVHEPSAFQLSKIELRSPQLGAPRYQVIGTWVGYGSQDIARLSRVGRHRFAPGLLHVFTATDLAPFAEASLRYHRTYPNEPGPALPIPVGA